jgi:hypothetical protein
MRAPLPRRLWSRERRHTKLALWLVLGLGAVASITVGSVWANLSSQDTNVGGALATGTMTLSDYANFSTTTLNGAITNSQTSITVASATGFPSAGNYTIQIDNEQLLVTAGQGTTSWTVTRGVNGTSAAAHSNSATVSTAGCSSIGSGASGNVNTSCDALMGYSASTENYPGTLSTTTVKLADTGSIGATDLTMWMPSCLRGVTPDASWASSTTSVSSYTGAATTGGHLSGNTTYYYEITAVVGGTEQVAGTETSYTTPVNAGTTNTITLSWSAVTGATAYKIYRGTVEGQEALLASPAGTGTSYNDTSATSPSGYPPTGVGSGNPCGQELTTTLNGSMTNSQTSITVSSAAGFPTDPNGNYRILVYDAGGTNLEYMTVTAGQGTTTWTVSRGVGGTSATSKTNGDTVVLLDDAEFYIQESGSTTLSSGITNSQTTIPVASANGFPTGLPYTVTVGSEQLRVTGGQGTHTWTVTRGYNSTTAVAHNSGDAVTWSTCWYPSIATTCAFDSTSDLGQFAANSNSSTSTIDFGPGQLAGNSRYFTFGFEIPNYASNAMQGTEALFTLRWHAQS